TTTMQLLRFGTETRETGLITIHLRAASGIGLAGCEKFVTEVEGFLEKNIPSSQRTFLLTEVGLTQDERAIFSENAGAQDATIRLQLASGHVGKAEKYVRELRRLFKEQFPGRHASFHTGGGASWPIVINVSGSSLNKVADLAGQISERVARVKGA